MLAKILYAVFGLIALIIGYYAYFIHVDYSKWLIYPVIGLTVTYIMSPQIDWFYYKKKPKKLPKKLLNFIQNNLQYYGDLPVNEKEKLFDRLSLFLMSINFIGKGRFEESVPLDIQALVGIQQIILTLGLEDYLTPNFENIVVYESQFPSPTFPSRFHSSELYATDGVILFSAKHLLKNFTDPNSYFNIGLYEFSKVFILGHPELEWKKLINNEDEEVLWGKVEMVTKASKEAIQKNINLPEIDLSATIVVSMFTNPVLFKEILPYQYDIISKFLNQDIVFRMDY